MTGLENLPVELLYEVHLFALSTALPITSRRLYSIFSAAPPSFRAQYILSHFERDDAHLSDVVSKTLRFPLCTITVLDAVLRAWPTDAPTSSSEQPLTPPLPSDGDGEAKPPEAEGSAEKVSPVSAPPASAPELPKRLFRSLRPPTDQVYRASDAPMPLLRYLYDSPRIPQPNANSHGGYALTRAVHAEFFPLIRLLLEHGASPHYKEGLAVLVAIRQKKLSTVRMLIERDVPGGGKRGAKKRRLEDRMEVTPDMLKVAVKCKARDIAHFFMHEKGCVPDIQTLNLLMR